MYPLQENKALWTMGKRKKPPKLPQRAVGGGPGGSGGMRMLYARVTTMLPDEVRMCIYMYRVNPI